MKVNIKGHIRDLLAFRRLVPARRRRLTSAPAQPAGPAAMNRLAQQLHPGRQRLLVERVRDETATTRTFRLIADRQAGTGELAYFRPGQYLSLKVEVAGNGITRPFSLTSAPCEALGEAGFYEITMRKVDDGFFTPHVWEHWNPGTRVIASGPCGQFYHEPLRDGGKIVGLAGGVGITPFCSMAKEIAHGHMEAELLLLYGSNSREEIVFCDLLRELEGQAAGRLKVVHVLGCDEAPVEGCEQGFITAALVRKYADWENSAFFVCGPQAMYEFVAGQLATLGLPGRRIRREVFGETKEAARLPGFPQAAADRQVRLRVQLGGAVTELPARAAETILVALERAGLTPASQCRSGECGVCRALLLSGEVFSIPDHDGRRTADLAFGYIHPCCSYPLTDLEIAVPRSA